MTANIGWTAQMIGLRNKIGGLRVVPSVPIGRTAVVSDDDDDDVPMPFGDVTASWSLFITYCDASGEESRRRISCKRVATMLGGSHVLYAFCHERGAPRAFRVERIVDAFDAVTGELVDPVTHLTLLKAQGLPFANQGMATFAKLCTFMARCDGHEHPREWDAIEHGLARYALRFGGDDTHLQEAVRTTRNLSPDSADFLKCLSALKRADAGPSLARLAIETCADIVDADGVHTSEEVAWSLEVGSALKRLAIRRD